MLNNKQTNQIKLIANSLNIDFEFHNLRMIKKASTNAYEISNDLIFFYPLNDGMPTCNFEFYKDGNLIINNLNEYKQISNLDDIIQEMIRLYNKALDNKIILDPYYFMLKLTDKITENYKGKAKLIITEKAIRNPTIKEGKFDEANKYYINHFLDHFIGWNFGVSINRSDLLESELIKLNNKVIDMGIREYAGSGYNVYGTETKEYNGLQHYKVPTEKAINNSKKRKKKLMNI